MKLLYAFICLMVGGFLAYQVKRQQFNRTNQYGNEEFGSYAGKVAATSIEKLVWGVALTLISIGAFLVIAA